MSDVREWFLATVDVKYYSEHDSDSQVCFNLTKITDAAMLAAELCKEMSLVVSGDKLVAELVKHPGFVKQLDALGYRDVTKLKDAAEKVVAGRRYYSYDTSRPYSSLREIDITKSTDGETLASDSVALLQEVDKSCLKSINKPLFDSIKKARNRSRAAKNAAVTRLKLSAEKKKQKELERAKKLLEQEGLKVS